VSCEEKVVWQLIRPYAEAAGVPGIAPHDCRRTCAKLCRAAGGELEQIQMLLGHQSVQTTERSAPFDPPAPRSWRILTQRLSTLKIQDPRSGGSRKYPEW
jgi:integrase